MKKFKLPKPQKVVKVGLKRKLGYTYYIDKDGDICQVKLTSWKKFKKAIYKRLTRGS